MADAHTSHLSSRSVTLAETYRLVLDSLAEQAIVAIDPVGQITLWNAVAEQLTGYPAHAVLGHSIAALYPPEVRDSGSYQRAFALALAHGRSEAEVTLLHRDETPLTVRQICTPLYRENSSVGFSLQLIALEPGDRQTQFWQHTAEQLRAFLEESLDPFFVHDTQGNFIDVNRAACESLGYSRDELLRLGVSDVECDFDYEQATLAWELAGKGESYRHLGTHRRKNGERYSAEVHIRAFDLEGKRLFIASVRDISARVRYEAELKFEKERFQKVVESSPALIVSGRLTADGRYTVPFASQRVKEIYGFDATTLAQDFSPVLQRVHPDDQEHLQASIAASAQNLTPWQDEFRYDHPTRGWRWIAGHSMPVPEPDGAIVWHGIVFDVTDRKLADGALREAAQRLQLACEASGTGVWERDFATDRVYLSPECETIFGRKDFRNLSEVVAQIFPDDLPSFEQAVARSIAEQSTYVLEFRIVRPSGEIRWISSRGQIEFDPVGQPLRIMGTVNDITDRKLADELVAQSEARLRATFDNMLEGCQILDHGLRYLYVNDSAARHGRTTREALMGRRMADLYPGVEQSTMYQALERCLRMRVSIRMENEFVYPDGQTAVFELSIQPVPEGVAVLSVEITERRRAEEQLRASEDRYRSLLRVIPEAVFVHSDFKITYCNESFLRLVGATNQADVIGTAPVDWLPKQFHELVRTRVQQMLDTGEPVAAVQFPLLRKDGVTVPVSVQAAPVVDQGRRSIVVTLQDITELKRATDELLLSERRYRELLEVLPEAVFVQTDLQIHYCNTAFLQLVGATHVDEVYGLSPLAFIPAEMHAAVRERIHAMRTTGKPAPPKRYDWLRLDGTRVPVSITAAPIVDASRAAIVVMIQDISEQRSLEAQLLQSQKLESIGRLAGGVAHDFNNLLTIIGINTFLLADALGSNHPHIERLTAVHEATERAAALTRQLLAFSRQQVAQPAAVDMARQVTDSAKLLRRLIGEDIVLETRLAESLPTVRIDPSQLDQVVMNLVLNARDAMPEGGTLLIAVDRAQVAATSLSYPDAPPGEYVRLTITDSGHGMPSDVQSRIFEPFFSTKEIGRGTGLGLSVVHGVVKQWDGHIFVQSTVGQGTSFTILLPASELSVQPESPPVIQTVRGVETILVVEDEPAVRAATKMSLEQFGFRVLEACHGMEALEMMRRHAADVQLVLTDVVMPQLNGIELSQQLRAQYPHVHIVFMSGYLNDRADRTMLVESGCTIVEKPFRPKDLAQAIRQELHRHTNQPSA